MTATVNYGASLLFWSGFNLIWQGLLLFAVVQLVLSMTRDEVARHRVLLGSVVILVGLIPLDALEAHLAYVFGGVPARGGTELPLGPMAAATDVFGVAWLLREPALWAWFVGSMIVVANVLLGHRWVRRICRRCGRVDSHTNERVERLAERIGLRRMPRVLSAPTEVTTPFVVGLGAGVLVLPSLPLPEEEWEALVVHELVHLKRRDLATEAALRMAALLLWWHPLFRWQCAQIRESREQCCDLEVVVQHGRPDVLARALVSLEVHRQDSRLVIAARGGSLRRRVERLIAMAGGQHHLPPLRLSRQLLSACAGTLVLFVVWFAPALLAPEADALAIESALAGNTPARRMVINAQDAAGPFRLTLINGRVAHVFLPGAVGIRSTRRGDMVRVSNERGETLMTLRLRANGVEWRPRVARSPVSASTSPNRSMAN